MNNFINFKKKYFVILVCIFLFGFFVRVYNLENFPSGFQRDEAFPGYNAYSILKTGKDINGNFLPIHLQSFLYTPAGYSYLTVPSIVVFGLNAFSVRFPAALFGALSIFSLFYLIRQLLLFVNNEALKKYGVNVALFGSLLLAISPWHINLSRTASLIPVVTFLIITGVFLFLKHVYKRKILHLYLAYFCFGASLLFYVAPYSFLPVFIPALYIIFNHKKKIVLWILFIGIILLPLFITLTSKNLSLRARTVSIFYSQGTKLVLEERIREDGVLGIAPTVVRGFHNKIGEYGALFIKNYFEHISFNFFFTDSALPDRYRVPGMGLLYLFELPLLICGIYFLIQDRSRASWLLTVWILLSPLGSALTSDDVPNLQRILFMLPPLLIIESLGFFLIVSKIYSANLKKIFIGFSSIIIFVNFVFYLHQYYVHARVYNPWVRQDGYRELVNSVNKLLPKYDKAIITNRESAPTIFFLFYSKFDPAAFQKETKGTLMQDFDRIGFGKYEFSQEECPVRLDTNSQELIGEKSTLYVTSGLCKPIKNINYIQEIKRSDGSKAFDIVTID